MSRISLIILFITFSFISIGQNIEIINKNENYIKSVNSDAFNYIEKGYDLKPETYIATMSGFVTNSGKSVLPVLFNNFWQKANELGANSFYIDSVKNNSDTIYVEISVYNLSDNEKNKIFDLYPKNMVYVFGDLNKKRASKKIKFNNKKMTLEPLEFISYQNQIGKDAILSIGGFLGAKVWIRGEENRLPVHLSLSKFGIGLGTGYYGDVSLSVNTGRIYPVDLNFGEFLINILFEKK